MKITSVVLATLLAAAVTVVNSQTPAPVVSIEVQVQGARAEDVETAITVPIERILSGLPNVLVVRSRTSETTSYCEVTFHGLSSGESIYLVKSALRDWKVPHGRQATPPVIKLQAKALLAPSQ